MSESVFAADKTARLLLEAAKESPHGLEPSSDGRI